jgi:hypothetical protein
VSAPDRYPNLTRVGAHEPFRPGNDHAKIHGAKVAAWKLAPRASEIAAVLSELLPVRSDADGPTVDLAAIVLARIEVATDYLDRVGLFDARGRPRPILKLLSSWENTAARLLDSLGLSPVSRAKLGLDVVRAGAALDEHLARNYGSEKRRERTMTDGRDPLH